MTRSRMGIKNCESSRAEQIAPPSCHPERKNAKRFEVEVLRRRSKTEERSDDGIYEGIPIAFQRKLTYLEKGDGKSR